ncbi:MAG: hypothetical protein AMJ79_00645 [Phycisphaerae bacterium SM23_30]|nr:MAG: hypothetical protein AMJ79_00645 [Phycisphaerae bacterium SM23_30]
MKDQNGKLPSFDLKSLEDELKKLPPPPIPADLESRLLEAIPAASVPTAPARRTGLLYRAAALAAVLVFALTALHYLNPDRFDSQNQAVESIPVVRNEEIMRTIEAETISARLLASAHILARQAGGESFARDTYQYLADFYPDTAAGREALKLIKN